MEQHCDQGLYNHGDRKWYRQCLHPGEWSTDHSVFGPVERILRANFGDLTDRGDSIGDTHVRRYPAVVRLRPSLIRKSNCRDRYHRSPNHAGFDHVHRNLDPSDYSAMS